MLEAEECFGDEGRRGGGHDERGDGVDLRDDELVDLGGGQTRRAAVTRETCGERHDATGFTLKSSVSRCLGRSACKPPSVHLLTARGVKRSLLGAFLEPFCRTCSRHVA